MNKRLLSLLLAVLMVFSLTTSALAAQTADSLAGKIVILHSNDVHGAIEGYAKIDALRNQYEDEGAEVILADAGDFCQGTTYVSLSKGASAVEMMNAAGYDVAVLGNHEFDCGYENLMTILKSARFKVVCGDVIKDGKSVCDGWTIIEKKGIKIGFVGLDTPETYAKVNPGLIQGLSFPQKEALYTCAQTLVDEVKAAGADLVFGLFHLGVEDESVGNRSMDVFENVTGLDFVLDGHSHIAMLPNFAVFKVGVDYVGQDVFDVNPCPEMPIQSTGTKFANVGVVVIDPVEKKVVDSTLVPADEITVPEDSAVLARAAEIEQEVDEAYGAPFARSDVELNGAKAPNGNRDSETNLGDLITDAMVWFVLKDTELKVPAENVVGITNGGGIRAWIHAGDVSMKDVNTVLPFGNTVAVVYVTGAKLLEALEASCFSAPTPLGGFPQISGLSMMVDRDREYDRGDRYPDSTYYGPKSIQRVEIFSINGKPFDPDAVYAVVTNSFCAAGGDTYYAFKAADDRFDTSIPMDEALIAYITEALGGVIGDAYAEPQGRLVFSRPITITEQPQDFTGKVGETAAFTVKATGDGLHYQWQYRDPGSSTWLNSSFRTAAMSCKITAARDGRQYRCVITDANNHSVTSDAATIIVKAPAITITQQPEDFEGAVGETASFTVKATGDGLTYQWQYRDPGSSTWLNSSFKTPTMSCKITAARDGRQYRCIVRDASQNSVTSAAATIRVKAPAITITQQPQDFTGKVGETAAFSVTATGDGLSYQWQYRDPGSSTWLNSSFRTAVMSCKITAARDGRQYRCIITDADKNSVTSDAATIRVKAPAITITQQPQDFEGAVGETAAFSVTAAGDGLTYQWQYREPGSSTWLKSSFRTPSMTCKITAARDGRQYRCVITDAHGIELVSKAATIRVAASSTSLSSV